MALDTLTRYGPADFRRLRGGRTRDGRPNPAGVDPMRQSDLALLCGVTQQAISAIESGRVLPRPATRAAIARALGVDEATLFGTEAGS